MLYLFMSKKLLNWDIYEVSTKSSSLTEVMLRGRIRKVCLENNLNVLVENAEDKENIVRFAILSGENLSILGKYLEKILPDVKIEKIKAKVQNPVLSKMKVNLEERYNL